MKTSKNNITMIKFRLKIETRNSGEKLFYPQVNLTATRIWIDHSDWVSLVKSSNSNQITPDERMSQSWLSREAALETIEQYKKQVEAKYLQEIKDIDYEIIE